MTGSLRDHQLILLLCAFLSIAVAACGAEQGASTDDSIGTIANASGKGVAAEWSIPLSPETPTTEYEAVGQEERLAHRIELRRDREYRPQDNRALFYRVVDGATSRAGRLYVLDSGRNSIDVFDEVLRPVGEIAGSRGAGPGDFGPSGRIAARGTGPCYAYSDRINCWDEEGELISASRIPHGGSVRSLGAVGNDDLVMLVSRGSAPDGVRQRMTIEYLLHDGSLVLLATFDRLPAIWVKRPGIVSNTMLAVSEPAVVTWHDSTFLTPGDEYQVFAYRSPREISWGSRTAWEKLPIDDEIISEAVEKLWERNIRVRPEAIEAPESFPALTAPLHRADLAGYNHSLRVDGHGHLYVFPLIKEERLRIGTAQPKWRPVDVYTADGQRIFSGLVKNASWLGAWGDYVYGVELDSSEEQYLVRYRLIEPFAP
jgi:hypothetical protein